MPAQDLKSRLDMLEQHIKTAEKHLKDKDLFSPDHAQTASQLRRRYDVLSKKLHDDVANAEAQGHQVSDLETSIRQWLDALEFRMD